MYVESESELNTTAGQSIDKNASQSQNKYQHRSKAGMLVPLRECAIDWGQCRILRLNKKM